VDYQRERQAALDYNSLRDLSDYLGKRFWKDLELHHPGINSLRLPAEVVAGWRERLLTKPKTVTAETGNRTMISVPRINFRESLTKVRAFYLDLSQWELEDPGRCAQWVAPAPFARMTSAIASSNDVTRRAWTRAPANGSQSFPCARSTSAAKHRRTATCRP
jgi:hypothetical protein